MDGAFALARHCKDELTVESLWLRTSQAEMGSTVRQISGQKLVMPRRQCRALSHLKREGYLAAIVSTHLGGQQRQEEHSGAVYHGPKQDE